MNERIRAHDLWTQVCQEDMPELDETFMTMRRTRKFSELIVAECAGLFVDQKYMILNPHEPFANERVRALKEHDKDTVKKIKHHFGVEE